MSRPFASLEELERLVAGFLDRTLPCKQWTHAAHLAVGLWHVREFAPDDALVQLREGIRGYNGACGVENSTTGGYHETITRFYVVFIGKYLDGIPLADRTDWLAVTNQLIEQHGARDLAMGYYTRERLMSPEARAAWVEPNLRRSPDRSPAVPARLWHADLFQLR